MPGGQTQLWLMCTKVSGQRRTSRLSAAPLTSCMSESVTESEKCPASEERSEHVPRCAPSCGSTSHAVTSELGRCDGYF